MALWCDRYRPTSLNKLDYNKEQADYLKRMIKSNDFPHLLVYGAPGSGKRTRVQCILREIYGPGVDKTRIEHLTIETPSNKKLELNSIASNYHIEVNPSDIGIQDRLVVQDVMKNIAQSGGLVDKVPFKVIVISEAHKLSKDAQHSLRRTMEKYISTLRLIMVADTSSTILPPIKSRCLLLRVAAPSTDKISQILEFVAKKENFDISPSLIQKIAKESERNLRRALLMMETMYINQSKDIIKPSYVLYIQRMAKKMVENPSLEKVKDIREDFYELEQHLIPVDLIFKVLIHSLLQICDKHLRGKLIQLASHYEHQMRVGSKRVLHFEAFVAHFMAAYQKFTEDNMIDDDDDLLAM
ncbi:replication factor C subunit 3 [Tetranychus urticae]|uniref:AAA+ ATPase domain-containing protein n=1 Tax=Tetranychus urticae TaxID=32264 RepID=T1KMG2_TETUR|nr:replication factor C subunit 3 [Tetranychus urticae]